MGRRLAPLTGDEVESLPMPCRRCLFWELGTQPPDRRERDDASDDELLTQKQAWVSVQALEGAAPGRVVTVDGAVAGYVLFTGPRRLASRALPGPRLSEDALVLATLRVLPDHRGGGLGRLLLQAAVKEAIARGRVAVEAYGDRRWRDGGCILPTGWLLHEGFAVHHEHPRFPLLRLDTRRTVRWADSLEHALEEVVDRLALPRRSPVPGRAPAPTRPPSSTPS